MKILTTLMFLYALSFAKGSFVDTKNHLEWQDNHEVEKETKWAMAKSYCKSLRYLGHNDWRLPTVDELKTITDMVQHPTKGKSFDFGTKRAYWTSEEYKQDRLNAWAIYMETNHKFWNDKCDTAYVRCVRDKY